MAIGANIAPITLWACWALVTIGARRPTVLIWACRVAVTISARRPTAPTWGKGMPASHGTYRSSLIFRTNLSLGPIQTGLASVVVGALPVHWAQHQVRLREWGGGLLDHHKARTSLEWLWFLHLFVFSPASEYLADGMSPFTHVQSIKLLPQASECLWTAVRYFHSPDSSQAAGHLVFISTGERRLCDEINGNSSSGCS